MSPVHRFALALADVAAFALTLGYIDHITSGPCRHCKRQETNIA